MNKKKADFINYEIWILTFGGGLQRANVYNTDVTIATKSEFRLAIKSKINNIVLSKYKNKVVSSDEHINTIIEVKDSVDINYSHILSDGEIKVGVVQKLINLYLKYQWCLGLVEMPPHCPFDRIIISEMKIRNPPLWTKMNSIEAYKMLVDRASELAGTKTIAEWELDVFARR